MTNLKIGQIVNVQCPVYRNGRKFQGKIISVRVDNLQCKIIIDGNSKSTVFAEKWVTALTKPHFSPLAKAMFNL